MIRRYREWVSDMHRAFGYHLPLGNLAERVVAMRAMDRYYAGYRDGFRRAQEVLCKETPPTPSPE